ncbi:MAG: hypothetical protein COB73_00780 [Flavobacteriaceae bacterium]|nr:MAG: hypothetical protein COB73_00780 [Flavobacteriaceae bacterium]
MNKIWQWLTSNVLGEIFTGVDSLITSDEERLALKNKLQQIINEKALESEKIATDIIQTEAKGNWLQRSWRPIIMLSFGFVVLYSKFIAPAFSLPNAELEPDFWELLRLGIGGYVIGRSAEKIATSITNKIEIKRKK